MKYEIKGDSLPVVICKLDRGDSVVTQAGGMSWHTEGISVRTKGKGGLGKMLGRAIAGESIFQNIYSSDRDGQEIAFASTFPGAILPLNISRSSEIIIQKQAFLASDTTVDTSVFFQKKFSAGLFGGEGFIMLKLSGDGIAFLEVDGSVHEYNLAPRERLTVDTGHLVAMDTSCSMSVEAAGNIKSMVFGGEGALNTVITGPGRVYIQSMPLSRLREVLGLGLEQK